MSDSKETILERVRSDLEENLEKKSKVTFVADISFPDISFPDISFPDISFPDIFG